MFWFLSVLFAKLGRFSSVSTGWILLVLFAVEGFFGMIPAIYTDLSPDGFGCGLARGTNLVKKEFRFAGSPFICCLLQTLPGYVAGQILMSNIFPFVLPAIAVCYPIRNMWIMKGAISDQNLRASLLNSFID